MFSAWSKRLIRTVPAAEGEQIPVLQGSGRRGRKAEPLKMLLEFPPVASSVPEVLVATRER